METCADRTDTSTASVNGGTLPFFGVYPVQLPEFVCYDPSEVVLPECSCDLPDAGKRLGRVGKQDYRRHNFVREAIADSLEAAGRKEEADQLRGCCKKLIVHRYSKGRKVVGFNECKHPLCPTAQLFRQRRSFKRVSAAVERYLERNSGLQAIMVVFTVASCPAHELPYRTGEIISAFSRLATFTAFKRAVKAYVRSVEFTRNAITKEFHPHIHALLFVPKNAYFGKASKLYIDQARWKQLWRKALRVAYDPVVHVQVMKGVVSPLNAQGVKALHEIIKYEVKPGSLVYWENGRPYAVGGQEPELYREHKGGPLKPMLHVPVRALCDAVKGRRLLALSRNLEANDDLDFHDDPRGEQKPADLGEFICTEFYTWRGDRWRGDYVLVGRSFDPPGQYEKWGGTAMGP